MAASEGSSEPGGKYAVLAPDVRGHSSWFLTRTNKEHQATMEHPWMKTIYARAFDRKAYGLYLASQYHVFRELEMLCKSRQKEWPLPAVYDELLHRTHALEKDLEFWCGADWRQSVASPSAKTVEYVRQLHADSGDAWLLLCHHFLQYNAVLSGGQFLGSMVSARAESEPDLQAEGAVAGAAFYDFAPECQPTHARVQRYIEAVDGLEISAELRDRMLVCMRSIYSQFLSLFDEAYAVAPTEGISYQASKTQAAGGSSSSSSGGSGSSGDAGSGGGGSRGPKIPPPPLDPADKAFTAEELLQHDGQRAGVPILTSVLGRVYDVTFGKEFFGKGGPYEMFAGHDGTYNLAVMSLKKQTLDKFKYELDDEDKECLADWIAYFDNRYSRPIGTLSGKQHSVSLQDLPRATKIPFSDMGGDEEPDAPASAAPAATSKL
uniref:Cytochrome b5 heme-binding domain-containing protein n=1 Tax=Alexandrium monilatum TaxID=311494 RepID=A0A7S4UUI2_9DINO